MKHTLPSFFSVRTAAALILLCATADPAFGGWASSPLETKREVFNFADKNGDGNINPDERDELRVAFSMRSDLRIIDLNGNSDLEREEIDALEQSFKNRDKAKKEKDKKKKHDKKLEKKFKKNR